ncbi:MAG: hypothetical protein EBU29_05515 [Gammaproteobacteria bacterium]|jgi:hypothetical protein|nr:hypothetical protein [Gammaproteobacteria bacterium]
MKKVLTAVLGFFAVLFVSYGVRWLAFPGGIAPDFGLQLGDGLGLSSLLGDLGAFFLTLGLCLAAALLTGRRLWFYPPAMLLLFAALGRTLAWLLHGAAFAVPMIVVELLVGGLILLGARTLAERD